MYVYMYRARVKDVAQERETNKAAAKQRQVMQSNQLVVSFPPFPVRHPAHGPGTCIYILGNFHRGVYK